MEVGTLRAPQAAAPTYAGTTSPGKSGSLAWVACGSHPGILETRHDEPGGASPELPLARPPKCLSLIHMRDPVADPDNTSIGGGGP